MTAPIPQEYLDEAVRRLNEAFEKPNYYEANETHFREVQCLARTLQELGWKPPVDPLLLKAREAAAKLFDHTSCPDFAADIRAGLRDQYSAVQAALIALREGMGE